MKKICVFGTYKALGDKEKAEVVKLGRLLAEGGFDVVSGGFGGIMEYVSQGAKSAGGKTVGVTYYRSESDGAKKANEFIDEEIRTNNIFDRISAMMKISDGFIVLKGGTGTLLELAAILEHINKGMIPPKPVIALGSFWKDVAANLSYENTDSLITFVKDAGEAVREILRKIKS